MDLFIRTETGQPLSAQVYEQIRDRIADGRLQPQDRLPPTRALAQTLGLSRHTVTTAYGRLAAEGYIEGRAGAGSLVSPHPLSSSPPPFRRRAPTGLTPSRRFTGWTPEAGLLASAEARFDLRVGIPDERLFPIDQWRRHVAVAAANHPGGIGDPAGEVGLRREIARWITRSRSVVADENAIVVTSGAQHAIDLLARLLLEPGDTVVVEEPGYLPVVQNLRSLGAKVVGVPVDEQGLVVDQLPTAARMIYVTPSHQFPLGVTMSMPRRRALLRWVEQHDAALIEDDYDSEFRHVDRPLEPIQRLDESGRVIYVGSFSKTLSPALRLGFTVVPESIVHGLTALRQMIDWHPPIAAQQALVELIRSGLLDRHIRRAGKVYTQRHRVIEAALAGTLGTSLTAVKGRAGLHIAAFLREGLDEAGIREAAFERGLATSELSTYYHATSPRRGLVIGFGAIATSDLPLALEMLEGVLTERPTPRSAGAERHGQCDFAASSRSSCSSSARTRPSNQSA